VHRNDSGDECFCLAFTRAANLTYVDARFFDLEQKFCINANELNNIWKDNNIGITL